MFTGRTGAEQDDLRIATEAIAIGGGLWKDLSLSRSDWSGKELRHHRVIGCDLTYAKFDGANLARFSIVDSDLQNASFKKANLGGARFSNIDMSGASFAGANLMAANLWVGFPGGVRVSRTDFSGVDFHKADLRDLLGTATSFKGAEMDYADLRDSVLVGADFSEAIIAFTDFRGAFLGNCVFPSGHPANWMQCKIEGASVLGAKPQEFVDWALKKGANTMDLETWYEVTEARKAKEKMEAQKSESFQLSP